MDSRIDDADRKSPMDSPRSHRSVSPASQTGCKDGESLDSAERDLRIAAGFLADGLQGKRTDDSSRACLCYLIDHDNKLMVQASAYKEVKCDFKDNIASGAPEISVLKSKPVTKALMGNRHNVRAVHVISSSLTNATGALTAMTSFASHYPAIRLILTLARLTDLDCKDTRSNLWNLNKTENVTVRVMGKALMRHLVDSKEITAQVLANQGPPINPYDHCKLIEVVEEQQSLNLLQGQLSGFHKLVSESFTLLNSNITRTKLPMAKVTVGLAKTFKSEKTTGSSRNTIPNVLSLIRHVKKDWRMVLQLPCPDDNHRHLAMLINDVSEAIQETASLQVIKQAFDDANVTLLKDSDCSGFYCKTTYEYCLEAIESNIQGARDSLKKHQAVDTVISQLDEDIINLAKECWRSESDTWCLNGVGLKVLTDIALQSKGLVNDLLGLHYQMQGSVISLHLLVSKLQLSNKTQALNLHKQAAGLVRETKVRQEVKGPVRRLEVILRECAGSVEGQGQLLQFESQGDISEPPSEQSSDRGSAFDLSNDLGANDLENQEPIQACEELDGFTDEEVLKLTLRQYTKRNL